ncbi:MAG: shikimate dehydrogenase family protein, partial [Planctomycetota bacterium]
VGHSLSPDVHNRAFELANHDGVYLPLPVPTEYEHLKATLGSLLHDPRLDFAGASVTVPHKTQILQIARDWRDGGGDRLQIEIDPLVDEVGAANTVVVRRGDEHAPGSNGLTVALHNTDAPALVTSALAALGAPMKAGRDTDIDGHACPTDLKGLRVAVIGAGGVARAAVAGFSRLGATVVIYNRTFDRAHALAEAFSQLSVQLQGDISEETSADARRRRVVAAQFDRLPRTCAHIIINCTPVGMQGGPAPNGIPVPESALLPASSDDSPRLTPEFGCCRADADDALIGTGRVVVEPAWFNGPTLIFDTIYNPFRTPLLRAAEANGLRTLNGLDMFIRQAAAQFTLWTGREPDQHAMRQAAARRLFEAGEA